LITAELLLIDRCELAILLCPANVTLERFDYVDDAGKRQLNINQDGYQRCYFLQVAKKVSSSEQHLGDQRQANDDQNR